MSIGNLFLFKVCETLVQSVSKHIESRLEVLILVCLLALVDCSLAFYVLGEEFWDRVGLELPLFEIDSLGSRLADGISIVLDHHCA